jgi:hypothetical protein
VGEEFVPQPDPGLRSGVAGAAPLPVAEPGACDDDAEHRSDEQREPVGAAPGHVGEGDGQQHGLREVGEGDGSLEEGGREQGAPCVPCGATQFGVDDHEVASYASPGSG